MSETTDPGGSRILQGCLFGAVALFVILLVVMVVLAYVRFREETANPPQFSPAALLVDG